MNETSVEIKIVSTGATCSEGTQNRRRSILKYAILFFVSFAMIIGIGAVYTTDQNTTLDSSPATAVINASNAKRNLRASSFTSSMYACTHHCRRNCQSDRSCLFWKKLCDCVDRYEILSPTTNLKDKDNLVDEVDASSQHEQEKDLQPEDPPTPITAPSKTYSVIVVGAGWSGISAASKLAASGVSDMLIIEARDYIGGRSRTTTDFVPGSTMPFELGSEWVYKDWDNPIVDALDKEKVAYKEENSNELAFFSTDGGKIDDGTSKELESRLWCNGFLRYAAKQSREIDGRSDNYNTMLSQYETDKGIADSFDQQFLELEKSSNVVLDYAGDSSKVSVRATMDWLGCGPSAMALTSVKGGGYGFAVKKIAIKAGIKDKISFNSVVNTIDYRDDVVTVGYTDANGASVKATAPAVLVTVPLGVLKKGSIDFVPDLPSYKQQAITKMQVGTLDKIIMYWDEEAMNVAPNFSLQWNSLMDSDWLELVTPETDTSGVLPYSSILAATTALIFSQVGLVDLMQKKWKS